MNLRDTLLAALSVLLWRYSGQQDFTVGTAVAGRLDEDFEGVVGPFLNTLPLRVTVAPGEGFRELLRRVKMVARWDHSLVYLAEHLRLARHPQSLTLKSTVTAWA